jgi:probable F420-dependent oxidoreductase
MIRAGVAIRSVDTVPNEFIAIAKEAERLGFESIWVTEELARSGFTVLSAAAYNTSSITLGTAIVSIYSRTPLTMAMEYVAMSELSNNRFILGLGAGGPEITSRGHGIPPIQPVSRMEEYLRIIRGLLAGDRFTYEGRIFQIRGIRLWARPPPSVKLYVAALNPGMLRVAGALADGIILNMFSPHMMDYILENLEAGSRIVGRDVKEIKICSFIPAAATSEPDAIESLKRSLGFYAAAPTYDRMFNLLGFGHIPKIVRESMESSKRHLAIPDQLVDMVSIVCDRPDVGDKLAGFHKVGVTPLIYPQPRREGRLADIMAIMRCVATLT